MEVIGMYLTCAEWRKVVSTHLGMADRSMIRRIADVVIFRASGIELDGESGLLGLNAEHGLGRR